MFHLLPNETLEYVFSFVPAYHFPLRQTCRLFREVIPPLNLNEFRDLVYEAGDLALAQCYSLPCSRDNLETILRKGHQDLFQREEHKLRPGHVPFAEACVEGRNRYIIDYLFNKGYVLRADLVYEACQQNYLELVREMFTEEDLYQCMCKAVRGGALDVLSWIVEKDTSCYNLILHQAIAYYKTEVLRWIPLEKLKSMRIKQRLFNRACSAPNMDMFNFLLEIGYVAKQTPTTSIRLVEGSHAKMLRTLVQERGWTLYEDMFDIALQRSCEEMLSCLLELGCPHGDIYILYHMAKDENVPWLVSNFPLTEENLLDICTSGLENVLLHLVREGYLPESFQEDPNITFSALEEGYIDVLEEYVEQEYTFYDDVCLRVSNPTSLEWLIENEIGLCPQLFYRLVREVDLSLLKKLEQLIDLPVDLLDYTFVLIQEYASAGNHNNKTLQRLKQIVEWIKTL